MAAFNMQLMRKFKNMIPKLHNELHKGQSGRIGIVGGSKEYSGAPYFSAISSLRVGADLSYVFTTKEAAPVIKSYTPELIVLPLLDLENNELEMRNWISKVHSLIIGPGLGRSEYAFKSVKVALNAAKSRNIPIIIDADALFVLSFDTSLVKGYTKCILTPNFMEFKRLFDSTFNNEPEYDEKSTYNTFELQCNAVKRLAEKLENVTILKKGKVDIISNGQEVISNDVEGSLKRCGGIGDLLTGTLGTFAYWTDSDEQTEDNASQKQATILAAYSASLFIKECSRVAFNKFHRATLAVDVIDQIPSVFYDMFDKAT